jgi:hypothetical protein
VTPAGTAVWAEAGFRRAAPRINRRVGTTRMIRFR